MDAPLLVERSRKTTIPAGTVTAADLAASSMTHMQQVQHAPGHGGQHPATMPVQPMDPQTMLMVEGVAAIKALSKNPQNRGPVFAGVAAGIITGALTAIIAVFWHDQSSGGRVTTHLATQDKAIEDMGKVVAGLSTLVTEQGNVIKALVEVTGGLLDEGEDETAWMESAFVALSKNEPIPARGSSGRKALRRKMPRQ